MWWYDAAASAAVWMKSLTEARRCVLAVMAWSNLIWCLLCVLWGTCWNSLSTDESYTSVDRGGKTWRSVWAKNNAWPWFVHPQEMFYPLLAALLAVDGNFCWMERETSNRCRQMCLVTDPLLSTASFPDILSWHDYPPLEKQGAPSAGKGQAGVVTTLTARQNVWRARCQDLTISVRKCSECVRWSAFSWSADTLPSRNVWNTGGRI